MGGDFSPGFATPTLALKESNNCAACHKPGRSQRPVLFRRCTLDCQGCHIDPSGAGPRNQWGTYYSHTSAGINALTFIEPEDPLKDDSRWDAHFDFRVITRKFAGTTRTFPMSLESALRIRPFVEYLHLTYQPLLLGKPEDNLFRVVREGDRGFRERFSVMIDQIPLNTYVKASRGQPMYGLRRPNHSLWIRERLGLDQFATTDAIEMGMSPNVPFFRASYMAGDPYAEKELRQKGLSYHAGLRGVTLGWHLNTSGWITSSERADVRMQAYGGGLNLFGLILYGEQNKRDVNMDEDLEAEILAGISPEVPIKVHPSSTIGFYKASVTWIPGIIFGGVFETLEDDQLDSERRSAFVDIHPIPFLQFEVWRRIESGTRSVTDTLFLAHAYADF